MKRKNKNIPKGEHCNGCVFLKFDEQKGLAVLGDCCKHGDFTCLLYKNKIEVDKVISNGTPWFQIPLYKKCDDCLKDTASQEIHSHNK